MPVELRDLFEKRTLAVPIKSKPDATGAQETYFTVWVSPDKFTKQVVLDIQAVTEGKDSFEIAERIIVPLVVRWDLTVDGQPYEITGENVAALGLALEEAVIEAIDSVIDFSGKARATSGAGSGDG